MRVGDTDRERFCKKEPFLERNRTSSLQYAGNITLLPLLLLPCIPQLERPKCYPVDCQMRTELADTSCPYAAICV
jgi:hypothetical protein